MQCKEMLYIIIYADWFVKVFIIKNYKKEFSAGKDFQPFGFWEQQVKDKKIAS